MSGFNDLESSYYSSESVETYEINGTFGSGGSDVSVCLCDSEFAFPNNTYMPTAIKRGSIIRESGIDNQPLEVTVAADCPLSKWFTKQTPAYKLSLIIRSYQLSDTTHTPMVIWVGTIRGGKVEGSELVLQCEPLTVSIKRAGLRRRWQYSCPHALYSDDCGAKVEDHQFTCTMVTKYNKNWYGVTFDTSDPNSTQAVSDWTTLRSGFVSWVSTDNIPNMAMKANVIGTSIVDGEHRIQLDYPLSGLDTDQDFVVAYGCRHTLDYCRDVLSNVNNYGGAPWIPLTNPIAANQFI